MLLSRSAQRSHSYVQLHIITVVATPKPPDDSAEYKRKSILEGRFLLPVENLTNVRSKYISTFLIMGTVGILATLALGL
jgi:hypothetical protein